MVPIFHARKQLLKVRGLTWFFLILAIPAVYYGIDLAQTYGLRPADGGVLAPLPVRLAFGGGLASLGLMAAGGMLLYNTLYIARFELDGSGQEVHITTPRLFGSHTSVIPLQDIEGGQLHLGQMDIGELTVNAPWHAVHIRGRKMFLILDLQGEILNLEAARRIFRIRLAHTG